MGWNILCFFSIFLAYASLSETLLTYEQHRVCPGTKKRFTSQPDSYKNLKLFYDRNCTFIDGNLEITYLKESDDNKLHFLSSIQVVTGYVLIAFNKVRSIPLHNLSIIRGMETLKIQDVKENRTRAYSLYVAMNYDKNDEKIGLRELQLRNLHDILEGDIWFDENKVLCYENTVLWEDIKNEESHIFFGEASTQCPPCHPSCKERCWGAGPKMCQELTKTECSETCDHRCYGTTADKCCHKECAGGCIGGRAQDCFACRNFNNDGTCVEYCPQRMAYNPKTLRDEEDPNGKYSYASLCVEKCPQNFLAYRESSCVPKCPPGHFADSEAEVPKCVKCTGACPQTCQGNNEKDLRDKYVNSLNIHRFKDCTTVDGHLRFLDYAFYHDPFYNVTALTVADLENLKDIREVTGYVSVQSKVLRNLSFLRNLEYIRGRQKSEAANAALEIMKSGITSLELRSLRDVFGLVVIYNNPNLCYVEKGKLDLTLINVLPNHFHSEQNRNHSICVSEGHRCDEECARSSCWGPGSKNCLKCKRKQLDDDCISWCNPELGIYDGPNDICYHCDSQCLRTCVGPGPTNCTACKYVKDGPFCRQECPSIKYLEPVNRTCEPCHQLCESGCSGPGNHVGLDGCNSCAMAMLNKTAGEGYRCHNQSHGCPYAYYKKLITFAKHGTIEKNLTNKEVCYQCHPQCVTCYDDGPSSCHACKHVKYYRECHEECPEDYYADTDGVCRPCHPQCYGGCYGDLASHCNSCKKKRVISPLNDTLFNCTETCPEEYKYSYENEKGEFVCSIEDPKGGDSKRTAIGIGVGVGAFVLIMVFVFIVCHMLRQRARSQERTAQLQAKMQGIDDSGEPLTPSDAKPDLSKLRLIKESELRQGSIIGSGAFGTVYKGVWIPEDEKVKIPVAIKVLQEGTSPNQNQELLEEARVMASVDHMYCVRILAVCMTAQMMLVTQLMPLGCLLDYVRKHRENIGSKTLLNWCTQIAKGMAYLEGRGIVHRDLAARNVLVHSNTMVKITDFGLAKLLDYEESEYHAAGGKMPIKWLALECIQHRVFTHKTDVWSFGVTLWELFTYGQKPYENVRAKDVPELLEKGERLVQPAICTIDVYMIMIKCWMLDADSRPSFAELADEFTKMSRDPGRYLVIQGDRLMRLPSQSYDAHDIMRSLSVATDGPEEVVTGDEYLQPSEYNRGESSAMSSYPPSPTSPFSPNRYGGGSMSKKPLLEEEAASGANNHYYPKRDKKYGALEAAAAAKNDNRLGRDRVDSLHSRYSSDPLGRHVLSSVREGEEVSEEAMPLVEDTFNLPYAPPVPLAVDEDDYLQPRSQCPQYIDVDDSENIEMEDFKSKQKSLPDYENIRDKPQQTEITMAMNNPEYFDCIPSNPSNNSKLQANGKNKSNHDYYNELDSAFHHNDNSAVC